MRDLSESRAYQLLRACPDMWGDLNVRIQFLKDWVKVGNVPVER